MRANKKRNSGPELIVRKLLHSLGYEYRFYARDLPGNPDIVFRSRQKAILVHGCFWHQHQDSSTPSQISIIGGPSFFGIASGTGLTSNDWRK
jgi:DNA mismatch endonuclease Vsr